MHKTLCFVLGLLVGVPAGVGGVVWQLKYGKAPVVAVEMTAHAEAPSIVEEPKPLDNGDEFTEEAAEPVKQEPQSETYHRMMRALIDHARNGGTAAPAEPEPPLPDSHFAVEPIKPRPAEVPMDPIAAPSAAVVLPVAKHETKSKRKGLAEPCTGTYPAELTEDGELQLPGHVHDVLGGRPRTLYLVPTEQYVWKEEHLQPDRDRVTICTPAGLAELVARHRNSGDDNAYLTRRWLSKVVRVDVTVDGWLIIPQDMIEEAGLEASVVLVGNGDGFELWNTERWHKEMKHDTTEESEPAPSDLSLEGLFEVMNQVLDHVAVGLSVSLEFGADCPETLRDLVNCANYGGFIDGEDWEVLEQMPQVDEPLNPQRIHGGIQ